MTAVLPPRTHPAPLLPQHPWTELVAQGMTVHAYAGNLTDCGVITRDGLRTPITMAIGLEAKWCGGCWPGRRCRICDAPSGDWSECRDCTSALLAAERARDAVGGWDTA
jgi:hypothetical protein